MSNETQNKEAKWLPKWYACCGFFSVVNAAYLVHGPWSKAIAVAMAGVCILRLMVEWDSQKFGAIEQITKK